MNSQTFMNFRSAIVFNDAHAIIELGTLTWINDVLESKLDFAQSNKALQPACFLLTSIATTLKAYHEASFAMSNSFSNATYSKLEALGWKTYQQLVRTSYKKASLHI